MRRSLSALMLLFAAAALAEGQFAPLGEDGIHDATGQAMGLLQEPAEAMVRFPVDMNGNIDWVRTIQDGHIAPRSGVTASEKMKVVDLDITMKNTASMPHVMFSHRVHTQWLTCSNCHSRIFMPQIGGNFITMAKIMEGEYCGVCHGSVAFTALQCDRCHTVENPRQGLR